MSRQSDIYNSRTLTVPISFISFPCSVFHCLLTLYKTTNTHQRTSVPLTVTEVCIMLSSSLSHCTHYIY
ncbi:hypothetical protein BDR03DRAFT_962482 [Suillus americanus]|nr:hypothetical protein BDR03DRAFT_962482 [Suillus americanus]